MVSGIIRKVMRSQVAQRTFHSSMEGMLPDLPSGDGMRLWVMVYERGLYTKADSSKMCRVEHVVKGSENMGRRLQRENIYRWFACEGSVSMKVGPYRMD